MSERNGTPNGASAHGCDTTQTRPGGRKIRGRKKSDPSPEIDAQSQQRDAPPHPQQRDAPPHPQPQPPPQHSPGHHPQNRNANSRMLHRQQLMPYHHQRMQYQQQMQYQQHMHQQQLHYQRQMQQQQQQQHQGHRKRSQTKAQQRKFEPYWSAGDAEAAARNGDLVEGCIRVNPKNYEDAYVPDPKGKHQIHVNFVDRNRALNGDRVCVQLKEKKEWIVQIDILRDTLTKPADDLHPSLLEELKKVIDALDDDDDDDLNAIVDSEESGSAVDSFSSDAASDRVLTDDDSSASGVAEADDRVSSSSGDGVDVAAAAGTLAAPTLDRVRENLPPEIRSLVDQMEKSWKEGINGDAVAAGAAAANSNSNDNKPKSRQRKNTPRSDSISTKSLTVLFRDLMATEAGQTLVQSFPDELLQKTGRVVFVSKAVHTRKACGIIKPLADGNPNMALFSPNDHRLPRMLIPIADCPKDFLQRPNDYAKTLFIAQIAEWKDTSMMAHGNIVKSLGDAGDIEPEHEGLLIEHGFDSSDFKDDVIACLPQIHPDLGFVIPNEEIEKRKARGFDFRSHCVFTVDPATARDLDDALHCEDLGGGIYEIGVHIADVSYFVEEGSALDKVASERATSVYMVHRMIPMLPRLLCERLCSLQPGTDRLAFSVVWKMNEDAEILDEKFGPSIIRSCAKLAYEHAQGFIDEPDRVWKEEELPEISDGWKYHHLVERILNLQKMARVTRKIRFQNGALRLDQVKLAFSLHPESRMPVGYSVYEHNDSHRLIEEFMLLANMAVATWLCEAYPEKAMLRRHPPPQENLMESIERFCQSLSLNVDISSSGALQASLQSLVSQDAFAAARLQVLTSMFSRPMQLAEYFCTGSIEVSDEYHHYALNVPLYTHFTSPIRRYPDVVVHRMLRASLASVPDSDEALGSVTDLTVTADRCNVMKAAAKKVSEASAEIFFGLYVKQCGPIEETGMVMAILDKSFDVFVMRSGVSKRVYLEKSALKSWKMRKPRDKPPFLQLVWREAKGDDDEEEEEEEEEEEKKKKKGEEARRKEKGKNDEKGEGGGKTTSQDLHIFSLVRVRLESDQGPLKYNAILLHPDDSNIFPVLAVQVP